MQKQYNQTLFVEVPKDAIHDVKYEDKDFKMCRLFIHGGASYLSFNHYHLDGISKCSIPLPSGEWEIVNPLNEITEEQALPLIEKRSIKEEDGSVNVFYINYLYHKIQAPHIWKKTALESLSSLATHLGFEEANIIVLQKKN